MTFKTRTAAATAALSIMLGSGAAMAQQSGLVNVSVDDNTVQVPVSVAANVCDVDVNVLSDLVGSDESACTIDQETAANSNSPMLQSAAKAAGKTDKINDKLDDQTEKLEDRAEKLTDKADKRADKAADKIEKARDKAADRREDGRQRGLVNVSVDGNTVQVPVGIAANVCDVEANVIARDFGGSDDSVCTIDQETAAENDIKM